MYNTHQHAKTSSGRILGTGWIPSMPDLRDYTRAEPEILAMTKKLGLGKKKLKLSPGNIDLKSWCSPVENQGNIGSCTAHAAMSVVEYFQRRAFGKDKYINGSRLFVYKTTRNLMQVKGDTGAWLRTTMGALKLCGVPNEKYWPYSDRGDAAPHFDDEPTSFVYAIADNYEATRYFCHDLMGANRPGSKVLASIKEYLVAGIPSMFGFYGFPSFGDSDVLGGIPYPCPGEKAEWGHAIVAVGYDDNKKITNTQCNTTATGALLIRNSWGTKWGDDGYGWLPYDYVLSGLASDFWSLLSMDWVNSKEFGI